LIGEFASEAALEIHDASPYLKTALAAMREHAQIKVTRLSRVDESLICATPGLS
jgi:quinol monooxygenase YgiN